MSFEYADPVAAIRRQARLRRAVRELIFWTVFSAAFLAALAVAGLLLR